MRSFVALLLTLSPVGFAQERSTVSHCLETCAQYVTERDRPRVCKVCLTAGDDGAWLLALQAVPEGVLTDEDWAVRWGAVRLQAKLGQSTPLKQLAHRIASTSGAERLQTCATALHVAGEEHQTLAELLGPSKTQDPAAANSCIGATGALVSSLEPDLFDRSPVVRRETLGHLAWALGRSEARVVLDAMRTRSQPVDGAAAQLLADAAKAHGTTAGRAVMAVATEADAPQVNRLLVVYSALRDAQRPHLAEEEPVRRLEAVRALAVLAPWSNPELESAVLDPSLRVRTAAASAIAAGEGLTLAQTIRAHLENLEEGAELRSRWVELLPSADPEACAQLGLELFEDVRRPWALRVSGLEAYATCQPLRGVERVEAAARSTNEDERFAALRASAFTSKSQVQVDLVTASLALDAPRVLAAACRAAAHHHLSLHASRVEALVHHPSPEVRSAAVMALTSLSPALARLKAAAALAKDPDEDVRCAAATALALVGGPQALHALTEALSDPSMRVKFVASDSLRKLGNGSP